MKQATRFKYEANLDREFARLRAAGGAFVQSTPAVIREKWQATWQRAEKLREELLSGRASISEAANTLRGISMSAGWIERRLDGIEEEEDAPEQGEAAQQTDQPFKPANSLVETILAAQQLLLTGYQEVVRKHPLAAAVPVIKEVQSIAHRCGDVMKDINRLQGID